MYTLVGLIDQRTFNVAYCPCRATFSCTYRSTTRWCQHLPIPALIHQHLPIGTYRRSTCCPYAAHWSYPWSAGRAQRSVQLIAPADAANKQVVFFSLSRRKRFLLAASLAASFATSSECVQKWILKIIQLLARLPSSDLLGDLLGDLFGDLSSDFTKFIVVLSERQKDDCLSF